MDEMQAEIRRKDKALAQLQAYTYIRKRKINKKKKNSIGDTPQG